jgi:nanoRNase/pAp phosphatase (c-di-AMP/oligoRNAs hydrolase)
LYNKAETWLSAVLITRELFENREYLDEFEAKFEYILGGLSGAHVELFFKKEDKNTVTLLL